MLWDTTTERNVSSIELNYIHHFSELDQTWENTKLEPNIPLISIIVNCCFCRSRVNLRHHKAGNHRNALHWTNLYWTKNTSRKNELSSNSPPPWQSQSEASFTVAVDKGRALRAPVSDNRAHSYSLSMRCNTHWTNIHKHFIQVY